MLLNRLYVYWQLAAAQTSAFYSACAASFIAQRPWSVDCSHSLGGHSGPAASGQWHGVHGRLTPFFC